MKDIDFINLRIQLALISIKVFSIGNTDGNIFFIERIYKKMVEKIEALLKEHDIESVISYSEKMDSCDKANSDFIVVYLPSLSWNFPIL